MRFQSIIILSLLLLSFQSAAVPFSLFDSEAEIKKSDIEATRHYNEGIKQLQGENLEAAAAAFEKAAEIAPNAVEPLLGLAEVALLQGDDALLEQRLNEIMQVAPGSAAAQLAWGRWQFKLGNFDEAKAALERAIHIDPENTRARFDLADTYMTGLRDPVRAEAAYREVVSLWPEHAGAHYGLGQALFAQRRTEEALVEFQQAASLQPDNPLAQLALGDTKYTLGDHEGAIAAYDTVLTKSAKLVPALIAKARALSALGEDAQALALLESALEIEPDSPAANALLGPLYEAAGRQEEAARVYRKTLEHSPDNAQALYSAARMSLAEGVDLDQAADWLARASALEPENIEIRETLALAQFRSGRIDEGITTTEALSTERAYRKLIELSPQNATAYAALGELLLSQNRFESATEAVEQALVVEPGNALALINRGVLELRVGDYSGALADFEAGLQDHPASFTAMVGKADAFLALDRRDDAIAAIESALAIEPDSPAATLKAAMLYQLDERYGAAISAYLKVTEKSPDNAVVWNNIAWMSAEIGQNLDSADEWIKTALRLDPDNEAFHDTQGWIHYRLGDNEKAVAAFEKALELNPDYEAALKHKGLVEAAAAGN